MAIGSMQYYTSAWNILPLLGYSRHEADFGEVYRCQDRVSGKHGWLAA